MGKRLSLVFVTVIFLFILIVVKLFFWQVVSFDKLKGLAEQQSVTSLTIPAKRGAIFATDNTPLTINQRAFLVYLEPLKIKNINEVVSTLSKELDIPTASISSKLKETNLVWVPIAHKVEEAKVESIKSQKLTGVGFMDEPKRFYPEASMAAHLLGFVGKDSKGDDQGYFGIEGYYDEQLRGRNGVLRQETDARGNPILSGKIEDISAVNGRDLTLTLDKSIQYVVEKKLKEGVEKYSAKGGTVTILDPKTGAVLAMAAYPSYDEGKFYNYKGDLYKNPVVASSYEPGSTFKVLIMAAALNEGKVKPDTKYNEEGPIKIDKYTIETWNKKYHGEISLSQILEYSSNVGMVFVAKALGRDLVLDYIERLGFGNPTDVDLQEETSPELRPKDKWSEIDYATASFGQGIALTPLQMVRAVAAIANGGKLMRPYIVKSIKQNDGKVIYIRPKVERNIFKKETTSIVSEMMVSAVDNGETKYIKPPGYKIAGKTGTAQIAIAGHYDTEKTIASFVGFAPLDDPKFVMLVTIQEPTTSPWGSETAAPVFFGIAKELFSYFGISPNY